MQPKNRRSVPPYATEYLQARNVQTPARMSCPTRWDERLACHGVALSTSGLEASVDLSQSLLGRWSIISESAVDLRQLTNDCRGMYYFETTFSEISSSSSSYIAAGFLFESITARLEGFAVTYSNQGCYEVVGHLQDLGDCFELGDIIGCGYDHHEHKAFFTRNGTFLDFVPIKSYTLCTSMRPYVRLEGFSGSLRTNFGAQPFLFDINYFVDEQQSKRTMLVDALEHAMWPREQEWANRACAPSPQQGALPTPPPSPRSPRRRSAAPKGPTLPHVSSSDAYLHPYAEGPAAYAAFGCPQEPHCCPSPPLQQQTPPASPPHRSRSPLHALRLRVFVYWDQKTGRCWGTSQDWSSLNSKPAHCDTDPVQSRL